MSDLENTLTESSRYYEEQQKVLASRLALLPKGAITEKSIAGVLYYYLRYRVGGRGVDEYIGKTVPRELVEKLEERAKLSVELRKVRSALRLLRKKPQPVTDLTEAVSALLKEFTRAGLWESGIAIVGSWCFLLYQRYLPLERYPLRTQEIDILVPVPYRGTWQDLPSLLKQLGFVQMFNPDGSTYFTGNLLKIDFLSPKKGRQGASAAPHRELRITAQLLRYTDILLERSRLLSVAQGVRVRLPSPPAFLLHKLLISTRWQRSDKSEKDLKQAMAVAAYVMQNPQELQELKSIWRGLDPGWRKSTHEALLRARALLPLASGVIEHLQSVLG
jgi:hypothetical protein